MTRKAQTWLSILDYAHFMNVSISTARRYIKSGRVKSRQENGKYLILVDSDKFERIVQTKNDLTISSAEITRLKDVIKLQREEIDELKMLVNLYEERLKSAVPSPITRESMGTDIGNECPPKIPMVS